MGGFYFVIFAVKYKYNPRDAKRNAFQLLVKPNMRRSFALSVIPWKSSYILSYKTVVMCQIDAQYPWNDRGDSTRGRP